MAAPPPPRIDTWTWVATTLFRESNAAWAVDVTDPNCSTLKIALVQNGFELDDFSIFTQCAPEDIWFMKVGTDELNLVTKRKLTILLAFFHDSSRTIGRALDITTTTAAAFESYRVDMYDPNKSITHWNLETPEEIQSREKAEKKKETDVANWRKMQKPTKSDYKVFKSGQDWNRAHDDFLIAITAHNLEHLIDPTHVPTNPELDRLQQDWLYNILKATFVAPFARGIVKKNKTHKNTRDIWSQVCEHYNSSMVTDINVNKIGAFLNTARMHLINFNGTKEEQLMHWSEQLRIHTEMSTSPNSNDQAVNLLSLFVSGVPQLHSVLTQHKTSLRIAAPFAAAGAPPPVLGFDTYMALLLEQAAMMDSASKSKTSQSANYTEQDASDEEDGDYEANVHENDQGNNDEEQTLDQLMAYQMLQQGRRPSRKPFKKGTDKSDASKTSGKSTGRRKLWMDKETWFKLSKETRQLWSQVDADDAERIFKYAATRKEDPKQDVNTHEYIFDDDLKNDDQTEAEAPKVSANTHKLESNVAELELNVASTASSTNKTSFQENLKKDNTQKLLNMATSKTSKEEFNQLDINCVLAKNGKLSKPYRTKAELQGNAHETFERSDFTPSGYNYEVNITETERRERLRAMLLGDDANAEPVAPARVTESERRAQLRAMILGENNEVETTVPTSEINVDITGIEFSGSDVSNAMINDVTETVSHKSNDDHEEATIQGAEETSSLVMTTSEDDNKFSVNSTEITLSTDIANDNTKIQKDPTGRVYTSKLLSTKERMLVHLQESDEVPLSSLPAPYGYMSGKYSEIPKPSPAIEKYQDDTETKNQPRKVSTDVLQTGGEIHPRTTSQGENPQLSTSTTDTRTYAAITSSIPITKSTYGLSEAPKTWVKKGLQLLPDKSSNPNDADYDSDQLPELDDINLNDDNTPQDGYQDEFEPLDDDDLETLRREFFDPSAALNRNTVDTSVDCFYGPYPFQQDDLDNNGDGVASLPTPSTDDGFTKVTKKQKSAFNRRGKNKKKKTSKGIMGHIKKAASNACAVMSPQAYKHKNSDSENSKASPSDNSKGSGSVSHKSSTSKSSDSKVKDGDFTPPKTKNVITSPPVTRNRDPKNKKDFGQAGS